MSAKFTPGPWRVTRGIGSRSGLYDIQAGSGTVYGGDVILFGMKVEANARLIAAAPDMAEALRAVLAQTSKYDAGVPAIRDARALLARIDGGSDDPASAKPTTANDATRKANGGTL